MSENKQDQLIRETFEQYRAGIGSMPSQRAQIIHKLDEKPARSYRPYYRLAAVAAALVLLLGIGVPVLSGNGFLAGHPDQVRTTGDLAAVQPEPTGFVPLAQPEGTPETAVQPEPEVSLNYHTWIDSMDRDLMDALVPVNLSYEKSGIRLDVLQGAVTETEALLVYSVEDLEGGRINERTYNPVYPDIGSFDSYENVLAEYDEAGNRCTYGIHVRYKDLAHCLDGPVFPLNMSYLDVTESKTAVMQVNPDSSESPALVAMPEQADWYAENTEKPDLKVMDYSSPQDVPLGTHVRVSQAGVVDGQFRVQFRYVDTAPVPLNGNSEYDPFVDVAVSLENQPGYDQHYRWDADGDGDTDFEEFVFTLNGKPAGALEYRVDLTETAQVLNAGWKVEVPLAVVWKGEASYSEISRRIEKKSIPDYVAENYPQFNDCLVPVDLSFEDQGIRMDIICGAVTEKEALFVYSVEDLEGARIMESVSARPVPDSDLPVRAAYAQLAYDDPSGRYTGVVHYRYNNLSEISRNGEIGLAICGIQNLHSETWHLENLLREYDGHADLVDLPVLLEYKVKNNFGGNIRYYTNEDYRKLGLKILESGEELEHLGDGIRVSAIGTAEGMLHLQLKYIGESDEYASRTVQVSCNECGTDADLPAWTRPMAWDTNSDGIADFEEYVFPCDPEALDNLRLEVTVTESDPAIDGEWMVQVPLARFPFLDI